MFLPVARSDEPLQKPSDSVAASGPGAHPKAPQPDRDQEIKELRRLVEAQKAELERQNKRLNAVINYLTYAPGDEGQNEDYAQARARFKTKLLRKGPAPGRWEPVSPPKGVTEVEYPSGELRLKAWVNRPADESKKRPAVVFLHGGFSFDMSDWDLTQPYRDAGFVVLTPILRGENGQPGYFTSFYDEVDDVLAAADYLSKQPYVDRDHVFLAGASVGGALTKLGAMASNRFRAAASCSGGGFVGPPERLAGSLYANEPKEVLLRNAMAFVTSFKCPLRLYYGTEEIGMQMGTLRAAAVAQRHGLDVKAVEVEGHHGTAIPRAIKRSIAFFDTFLDPGTLTPSGPAEPLPKTLELDLGAGIKMNLVRIEPGKFLMGSPMTEVGRGTPADRYPDQEQRVVEIKAEYAMGVYPVTQAQYRQVMGTNPSRFSPRGAYKDKVIGLTTDDFPVEGVDWYDAMEFCRLVSLLAVRDKGWVVDLPTEAEWEYACRAGTTTVFYQGNTLSSRQANFNGTLPYGAAEKGPNLGRPTKCGSYPANAWGLYDMSGNVYQWCKDPFDRKGTFPSILPEFVNHVTRGGSFAMGAVACRSASRSSNPALEQLGFRVVVRVGTPSGK
jgi:formylglycine-generating enzyme required for sulfatase activity